MHLFEALGVFIADPARFRRPDEAQAANEKYAPLENSLPFNALQLAHQAGGRRIIQPLGERGRADRRAIVELDLFRPGGLALLAARLQGDDAVDEDGIGPRLGDTFGLLQRDDVRGSFLDDREAIAFQLAKHRRLPRSRRTSQDVSLHSAHVVFSRVVWIHQDLCPARSGPTTDFLGTGAGPVAFGCRRELVAGAEGRPRFLMPSISGCSYETKSSRNNESNFARRGL